MEFREWLIIQEVAAEIGWDETQHLLETGRFQDFVNRNKKRFLYPLAMTGLMGGSPSSIQAPANAQSPVSMVQKTEMKPMQVAQQTPVKKDALTQQIIAYVKQKYPTIKDSDIEITTPANYIKQYYGGDWDKARSMAAKAQQNYKAPVEPDEIIADLLPFKELPGRPDMSKFDDTVVVIKKQDPDSDQKSNIGMCRTEHLPSGKKIQFCFVRPTHWGNHLNPAYDAGGHELSHTTQLDNPNGIDAVSSLDPEGNKTVGEFLQYWAKPEEFAVHMGQLKRWYYKETGIVADGRTKGGRASDIVQLLLTHDKNTVKEKLPFIYSFHIMSRIARKQNKLDDLLKAMDQYLPQVVQNASSGGGQYA